MDHLSQLGKNLRKTGDLAQSALKRDKRQPPYIERCRDVFDPEYAFEMEFESLGLMNTKGEGTTTVTTLDLKFAPPPTNCCCTECFCAQCEYFSGITDATLTMSHDIIDGTVKVLVNDIQTSNFTVTVPRTVNLGFTPSAFDVINVCYTNEVKLFGSTSCADCQFGNYYVDENFVITNQGRDITVPPIAIGNANGLGAAVAATWATVVGNVKWAHQTTDGSTDTELETIPFYNLIYAVDNNPLTCSFTETQVLRIYNPEQYACVDRTWIIAYAQPVKLCSIGSPSNPGITAQLLDGSRVSIPSDPLDWPEEGFTVTLLLITFQACGQASAFSLWGVGGVDLCDLDICVVNANCSTLLQNNLL